jgi:hypothetical protein
MSVLAGPWPILRSIALNSRPTFGPPGSNREIRRGRQTCVSLAFTGRVAQAAPGLTGLVLGVPRREAANPPEQTV